MCSHSNGVYLYLINYNFNKVMGIYKAISYYIFIELIWEKIYTFFTNKTQCEEKSISNLKIDKFLMMKFL